MINFPENLKKLRNAYHHSTNDLADLLSLTVQNIKSYEQSKALPSIDNMISISNFFGVSIDYLLIGNKKNKYINYTRFMSLIHKIEPKNSIRNSIENTLANIITNKSGPSQMETEKTNITADLHANLKLLRTQAEITQDSLAKSFGLKWKYSVMKYEQTATPQYDTLLKYSNKFNISVHYLVTGKVLAFDLKDGYLKENALIADKNLNFEDVDNIIKLLEKIIKNKDTELTK